MLGKIGVVDNRGKTGLYNYSFEAIVIVSEENSVYQRGHQYSLNYQQKVPRIVLAHEPKR